jgi:Domain of unknown function (DUF1707)
MQQAGSGGNRGTRASDADRDRIAAALGDHLTVGRLTPEEFNERLDRAYAAKTLGELDDLMADLPRTDLSQLPGRPGGYPPLPERREPGTVQPRGGRPGIARVWLIVTISLFALWLISGTSGGPWLLLAAIVLVIILLRRLADGGHRRDHEHHPHPRGGSDRL